MKKANPLKFTFILLLFSSSLSFAQQSTPPTNNKSGTRLHCATEEALEAYLQQNPAAKALADQNKKRFAPEPLKTNARVNAITTIPIVFHIVGSASRVALVTDADVLWQLNKMNDDFAGSNADSTNATAFYNIRAHNGYSQIRFCLAQRDPNNNSSNGITRTVSSLTSVTLCSGSNYNMLKHTSQGGIDAWDPTRYFNVWIGEVGSCFLGIAQPPGVGNASEFGVVLAFDGFSNNPAYVDPNYNLGRTLVHETGHCFGLNHIWGDDAGCSASDFRQLSGTCILPASLAGGDQDQTVGDTPNQGSETTNCPSGIVLDNCATVSPGKNYQNFMDYTLDACYSMFTLKQVDRMQYVLDNCLASLKTSNGCVPIVLLSDDASITSVITPSPGLNTCSISVPISVTLKNTGGNPITSVTITVKNNGTTVQTFNWTGNLIPFSSVAVPLNAITLTGGNNIIDICSSLPNGNPDPEPANDCTSITVVRIIEQALPLVEGFENASFPPASWLVTNPDNSITWQRNTTGVAHGGLGTAWVNHFNYSNFNADDDLRTPAYTIGTADSLWVSFWGAYRGNPNSAFENFQVLVSTDCGQNFQVVYNARNDTAFVAPPGSLISTSTSYFPSVIDEWVKKSIDLSSRIPAGSIQVKFKTINEHGNNFFLDDVNIDKKIFPNTDAGVIAINNPTDKICSTNGAPQVVIKNFGKNILTSAKVNFQIDGGSITTIDWTGNLSRNQTATVNLPSVNFGAVGNHSINAFTTLPNNSTDEDATNDNKLKPYIVSQIIPLNTTIIEEFTNSSFPPANWLVINPNADMTWQRNANIGNKNPGSAWFNDYNNTSIDRMDDLSMPNYSYSGYDSIFLTFNVANSPRIYPPVSGARVDTLQVLVSKDCGNTYTSVYKKFGQDLWTISPVNGTLPEFFPTATQWRRDSVNLGTLLGSSEPLFQVAFRFSGNMENNIFLDDINIRPQILPQKLKTEGLLVLPNPFRNYFAVWHYQQPTDLRYINVYNVLGQLIWSKQYPYGGEKYIQIDLTRNAGGVYMVNIGYKDKQRNLTVQVVKY